MNKILELVHDEQNVSFCFVTTDMWSSQSVDADMALAIHFMKKATSQRISAVRQCLPFAESYTAENLLLALDERMLSHKSTKGLVLILLQALLCGDHYT